MDDKRIDFLARWGMAFFAVLVVLVSWLGNSINNGVFGIMFWPGVVTAAVFAVLCASATWAAYRLINQPEKPDND